MLDPIDGTRAFITGLPSWGTLIGLLHEGTPVFGMMAQAFTRERYWGDGAQAWYRGPDGKTVPIRTRACAGLSDAALFTTTPALFKGAERPAYDRVEAAVRLPRYGFDCYAYCMVAAGHADLVIEAGLKPYDIVALIPIIQGAGGQVTSWEGGSAAQGGRIVAAATARVHADGAGDAGGGLTLYPDPGTKASKAAQNCALTGSRSIMISWCAPGMTTWPPARSAAAIPSAAVSDTSLSSAPLTTSAGTRIGGAEIRFGRLVHRPAGGVEPAEGRRPDGDLRQLGEEVDRALVARRVAGQPVAVEGHLVDGQRLTAGDGQFAQTDGGHEGGDAEGIGLARARLAECDQRRDQHQTREAHSPVACRPQADQRTGGMGEREMRRRAVGQRHVLHEGFEVVVVFLEAVDMAFHAVAQTPFGPALPAPVERGNGEAAAAQVADGLEVLFDGLAAALHQADGAERLARRRAPAGIAQPDAVAGERVANASAG